MDICTLSRSTNTSMKEACRVLHKHTQRKKEEASLSALLQHVLHKIKFKYFYDTLQLCSTDTDTNMDTDTVGDNAKMNK